jgi:glycosyltransferase involved in cell wall biosynthesis
MVERVALFTGNYTLVVDGVACTLHRLVGYLQDRGVEVLVLSPRSTDPSPRGPGTLVPVRSVAIPGRPEYRLALWPSLQTRRRLRQFNPQLLHVATPDLLGVYALRFGRRWDAPVVATYHTHFPRYLQYYHLGWLDGLLNRYLRWFYRKCDLVCAPTDPIRDALAAMGIDGRLAIWGRGVDTDRFHPRWRSSAWRRGLGIDPDQVVIAYVGRLVREKGLEIYADVLEALRDYDRSVRGLVVGEGPLRPYLERRLPESIFTGHLEGKALSRAYASSDMFLFPSDSEAFGNVIIEAMASGLAIVAANRSGSSAHLDHERTGLLAPPHDADAFLRHTIHLLEKPGLRRGLGRAARQRAEESYDWEMTLARMGEYYEQALTATDLSRADIEATIA